MLPVNQSRVVSSTNNEPTIKMAMIMNNNFHATHFYFDSKWKVLSIASGEFIEMLVQLYGLSLFGGVDLLNSDNVQSGEELSKYHSLL